ncbi:CPBP family intramembrane glutamic endopeptidase [Lewinella sp. JB7]|uniref:CPBP family intramembrane glutamic endopeptidase n=1 Tax=Lewinella sp. JB7 TaxID=2962887 RepID=UPI0020CA1987|nr:CPBP family intramembrane glutamic endopeptidase [Lewinella sp. JB7]MCP9237278.1 CPBP family intramembrane metalloprotease [Lewinella sp. JB7]
MADPFRGTSLRLLLFTVLSVLAMLLLGGGIVGALALHYGLPIGDPSGVFPTVADRQQLRFVLLLNNLFTFGLSATLALYLTYRHQWPVAVGLVSPTRPRQVPAAVGAFLIGLPLIGLSAYLNLQVDLPDWMVRSEDTGNAMLAGVLTFERLPELLLALLTVAVVPAVCEELMFRGLLQGRLLTDLAGSHLAVWIAALIFSAIHVEFAGFVPRLLLGALLGYAYRWTGSLWIPIGLHFLFNGTQVLTTYLSGEFTPDTEMDTAVTPLMVAGILSLGAVIYLVWRTESAIGGQPAAVNDDTSG